MNRNTYKFLKRKRLEILSQIIKIIKKVIINFIL